MDSGWKKLSTKKVFETPWMYIDEDKLVTPAGKEMTYCTVRKPVGGVVVPFDGEKVYLVRVFRPSVFRHSWELPMGTVKGKADEEICRTELKEETGFTAGCWTRLGDFIGAPGTSSQAGVVYLAEGLTPGQPERDDGEADMELKNFSLEEIDEMVAKGEVFDGWTLASLYLFKQYLSKKK